MGKDRQDLSEAGRAMGPLAEIMRQVREGKLTADQLQLVVEGKNPFLNAPEIFLVFWPLECHDKYEGCFDANESEFCLPINIQVPVGSQISFLTEERTGVDFKVVRFFWCHPENRLLIQVKVEDTMEASPEEFARYIRKNW